MPSFDTVYVGFHAATMVSSIDYDSIKDAAIAVENGHIAWIGPASELPNHDATVVNLGGGWVTPGLVDCHTHLVFGGDRSAEYEMRLQGLSYEVIAKSGGGIVSTVTDTRKASVEELLTSAKKRLQALMADGVTCVEVKSGYGLDLATEEKMLRVARALGDQLSVTLRTTCLAAHALPQEYQGQADAYIDLVCEEIIPTIAKAGLADAVDGFCESIAFSVAQIERVFKTALAHNLPVKLHAEQLSNLGGSGLAARYKALSSDHLEYLSDIDAKAMAAAGTVAVILPGAFFCLKETKLPPIQRLRDLGVPMAIASDSNPGSAPVLSLRLMMSMACTLFGFTPLEALQGVTRHGAQALGLGLSHGQLKVGYAADFVCWDIQKPAELSYWLGGQLVKHRAVSGELT
ncbi:imidazolonepropionase [Candidatus Njordibacter sp. Uisw_039]|uniref:imidazolonepropionase n=1 Tax=Candidatus Njordibacter sp. Uisw_039 TaxID=3230972 RepID=UPI003D3E6965